MSVTAWRPRNETAEDLEHENSASQFISDCWNLDIQKLSEVGYKIDWSIHYLNGDLFAFAEYKFRKKKYDTVLLSYGKFCHGLYLSSVAKHQTMAGNVPFLFFVEWPDGLYYANLNKVKPKVELGGNSRGQNGDIEPVVHIPISAFKLVKKEVDEN